MARKPRHRALLPSALAAGLLACAASSTIAGEASYCVTCSNPDQVYLCTVEAGGAKPSDALKLYCVIRTAKEGHHASCSAERASPACKGLEKVYSYDGPLPEDLASEPHIKRLTKKIEKEQKAFEKPKGDGPNTLVELTGRAVSAARNGFGGSSQPADQTLPQDPQSLNPSPAPPAALEAPVENPEGQPSRMQRASSAVGGLARKSYRCVVSLFRNCRSEATEGAAPQ